MGTTQRIGNGVKNEPNWGNLSSSVTGIAKAIEKQNKIESDKSNKNEDVLDQDENIASDNLDEQRESKISKLEKRKNKHLKTTFQRFISIGGGIKKISSGNSKKVGRAGLNISSKLSSFFTNVGSLGLNEALRQIGFDSFDGKNIQEVIDFLKVYFSEPNVGMDEAAANSALCEVFKEISLEVDNNDNDSLSTIMTKYADSSELSKILCVFFGKYIYEYLWERLEERLRQNRGEEISKATFESIKKEIEGRVQLLNSNRPLEKINWRGEDGKKEIEKIFEAILKIEEI